MKNKLFRWVWSQYIAEGDTIVKITSWRSCLRERIGWGREHVTFMPIATWNNQRKMRNA